MKILWHDRLGLSLYAKRLERGCFLCPSPTDGCVAISASQLGYVLDGIDWRNLQRIWRPEVAGCGLGYTAKLRWGLLPGVVPGSETIRDDVVALRAALAAE